MRLHREMYWAWAHADLVSNAERGIVAEYIVGTALNALTDTRREWDAWDLTTAEGIKIEVKSSGYVQSWNQTEPSKIRFDIKESLSWYADTNSFDVEASRSADIYVFCVHAEKDKSKADPLETDQWEFYVLSSERIYEQLGKQKTVGLAKLIQIGCISAKFDELAETIKRAT